MLYLIFHLGDSACALRATEILEVTHALKLSAVPGAPKSVAGRCNFRGRAVPVVDLCELGIERPARPRLSTRIIMAFYPSAANQRGVLGLRAERVDTLRRIKETDFVRPGISVGEVPFLGDVAFIEGKFVQRLVLESLLPPELAESLFQMPPAPTYA
jgi:chemotaxis-related protein WspB